MIEDPALARSSEQKKKTSSLFFWDKAYIPGVTLGFARKS